MNDYNLFEHDVLVKVLLLGASGAGKSALAHRYCSSAFSECAVSTIGVDFALKSVQRNQKLVRLQVWDTAGQEAYNSITRSFYRGADGVMFVFALTDRDSFERVTHWLEEVQEQTGSGVPYLLCGAKADLAEGRSARVVSVEEAQELARRCGMLGYVETSAKTGAGVDTAFERIMDGAVSSRHAKSRSAQQLQKNRAAHRLKAVATGVGASQVFRSCGPACTIL